MLQYLFTGVIKYGYFMAYPIQRTAEEE